MSGSLRDVCGGRKTVDFFASQPGTIPPVANFLSHVHSDHLKGLASKNYGGPFIYCTAVTKQLLLRLEKKIHRLNMAKRIVECHSYSYLDIHPRIRREKVLRELPLGTPTEIELRPGVSIRVTLFDANHCPGSCMFLIEGQGKAILYSGDVRAERWWVRSLMRNPILLPYTSGIKTLDKMYLDTTHADTDKSHYDFGSKADGIRELLTELDKYPQDTIFHINTWTFGYEEVWTAIAGYFDCQIHVDTYKYRLYRSCAEKNESWDGPYMNGFSFGNSVQAGVLTEDPNVRFHSCERGSGCPGLEKAEKIVYISPVIKKFRDPRSGMLVLEKEMGESGGGGGDCGFSFMRRVMEHTSNTNLVALPHFLQCDTMLLAFLNQNQKARDFLRDLLHDRKTNEIHLHTEDDRDLNIDEIAAILIKKYVKDAEVNDAREKSESISQAQFPASSQLRTWFGFPFARHSSYHELRDLVNAFRPRDVYPCVVPEQVHYQRKSIRTLFGDLCTSSEHAFDKEVSADFDKKLRDQEKLREEYLEARKAAGFDVSTTTIDVSSLSRGDQRMVAEPGHHEEHAQHIEDGPSPSEVSTPNHLNLIEIEKSVIITVTSSIEVETDESDHTDEEDIKRARDIVLGRNGRSWHTLSKTLSFNNKWKYEREDEL